MPKFEQGKKNSHQVYNNTLQIYLQILDCLNGQDWEAHSICWLTLMSQEVIFVSEPCCLIPGPLWRGTLSLPDQSGAWGGGG